MHKTNKSGAVLVQARALVFQGKAETLEARRLGDREGLTCRSFQLFIAK